MRWADRTEFEYEEEGTAEQANTASPGARRVLDLTVSNPTRCGFTYDEKALLDALVDPRNLCYSAEPFGPISARETIVRDYYGPKDLATSADHMMLTASTSEAYGYLFRLLCNPGDEVLVPSPSYPLFDLLARFHDVELRHYPLYQHDGWSMDVRACEQQITDRTRAIIVVNPNNPTGHFISDADRRALYEIACRHNLAVIADEVFLDYPVEGRGSSFLQSDAPALTFVLTGLSKVLALPQMKLAWTTVHGPEAACREAISRLEFIADTFLPVSVPVANALPHWLQGTEAIQTQIRDRVRVNLEVLDELIAQEPLISRLRVEGGWSVILRVPAIVPDTTMAELLMQRDGVLVHPGSFYGLPVKGYLVASLLAPTGSFREGVTRLATSIYQSIKW